MLEDNQRHPRTIQENHIVGDKETYPKDEQVNEAHDDWFKEYLQKEQTLNFERLMQQEMLLNITQKLMHDMN